MLYRCTKEITDAILVGVKSTSQKGEAVGKRRTFSNSGSHESNVSERTLEQWTPKLLKEKRSYKESEV